MWQHSTHSIVQTLTILAWQRHPAQHNPHSPPFCSFGTFPWWHLMVTRAISMLPRIDGDKFKGQLIRMHWLLSVRHWSHRILETLERLPLSESNQIRHMITAILWEKLGMCRADVIAQKWIYFALAHWMSVKQGRFSTGLNAISSLMLH